MKKGRNSSLCLRREGQKRSLNIGRIPGRKRYALYMVNDEKSLIEILAYFADDESAATAVEEILAMVYGG